MLYELCHKDILVATLDIDVDTGTISRISDVFSPERIPVGVPVREGKPERRALNEWWTGRSIPASRFGLDKALRELGVSSPRLLLTKSYGLSLSDQYWVKPKTAEIQWKDVNFFDNAFSEDIGNILFGEAFAGEDVNLLSPDNTSDGWLQKKWKIIDGKRCLIKGGSNPFQQEPYNEVLATFVCKKLGIAHVPYSLMNINDYPYSVCDDFVNRDTELVSAWNLMQTAKKANHVSWYQHYLNCANTLGVPGVTQAIDEMFTLDYLIANEDRHLNNFGVIRNANTLEYIGVAPIYDSGTSMWHDLSAPRINPRGRLSSKPFKDTHAEQIKLVTSFEWLDLSTLNDLDEEFDKILKESEFIENDRREKLCIALKSRVELLGGIVQEKQRPCGIVFSEEKDYREYSSTDTTDEEGDEAER